MSGTLAERATQAWRELQAEEAQEKAETARLERERQAEHEKGFVNMAVSRLKEVLARDLDNFVKEVDYVRSGERFILWPPDQLIWPEQVRVMLDGLPLPLVVMRQRHGLYMHLEAPGDEGAVNPRISLTIHSLSHLGRALELNFADEEAWLPYRAVYGITDGQPIFTTETPEPVAPPPPPPPLSWPALRVSESHADDPVILRLAASALAGILANPNTDPADYAREHARWAMLHAAAVLEAAREGGHE